MKGWFFVSAEVVGPTSRATVRMALDTGATYSLINVGILVAIGHDPALIGQRIQVTTGSNVEFMPLINVGRLRALGTQRENFQVLAHTLPPSAVVDGLLGLDFLRGMRLSLDFRDGTIELA